MFRHPVIPWRREAAGPESITTRLELWIPE
jgi:hypothetical protein